MPSSRDPVSPWPGWCRPPVLPRILLVFNQTCDFYTRAAEEFGCQGWSRTSGHLFQGQGSVPTQSAWQYWRYRRVLTPYFSRDRGACRSATPRYRGILAGQPGSAPGTTVLETVMMLFHHWPLDRATGIAPALSSLGTKRVAGSTTPGRKRIFLERPTGLAPASRVWKARALLLSYGRLSIGRGWTPRCSPPMGSTPASLCSGPIVKGSRDNTLPATRPVPGNSRWRPEEGRPAAALPAPRPGQQKNPALVSEGGV